MNEHYSPNRKESLSYVQFKLQDEDVSLATKSIAELHPSTIHLVDVELWLSSFLSLKELNQWDVIRTLKNLSIVLAPKYFSHFTEIRTIDEVKGIFNKLFFPTEHFIIYKRRVKLLQSRNFKTLKDYWNEMKSLVNKMNHCIPVDKLSQREIYNLFINDLKPWERTEAIRTDKANIDEIVHILDKRKNILQEFVNNFSLSERKQFRKPLSEHRNPFKGRGKQFDQNKQINSNEKELKKNILKVHLIETVSLTKL